MIPERKGTEVSINFMPWTNRQPIVVIVPDSKLLVDERKSLIGRALELVVRSNAVSLKGAELSNQNLQNLELSQGSFPDVNFRNANLSGSELNGACMMGANLFRANLSGTICHFTDFRGANLSEAYMEKTDLSHSNLAGAFLDDVYMEDVKLDGTLILNGVLDTTSNTDLSKEIQLLDCDPLTHEEYKSIEDFKDEIIQMFAGKNEGLRNGG